MAGSNIQIKAGIVIDNREAREALQRLAIEGQTAPLMRQLGEAFQESTERRFTCQTGPDGSRWAALSPSYARRKRRNADKILTLRGTLRSGIRHQVPGADTVLVGTNMGYGAIHQLGGIIRKKARRGTVYFKESGGNVGNRFVRKSNFAQDVNIGAHSVTMPARPYLGLSAQDRRTANEIITDWLARRAAGTA